MEERIAALEKSLANLINENSKLKQEINSLNKKVAEMEKNNKEYFSKIENLEKRDTYSQIQNKLTNAPKLDVKHDHKKWINTVCLINGRCIITGSRDQTIKGIQVGDEDEEKNILFTINNAHDRDVNYIMKVDEHEIISCGDDGVIKRWYVDCSYSFDNKIKRYELLETFTINGSSKAHKCAYDIIRLKNGDLCSCGNDSTIKFWKKNNVSSKYENYKVLKCEAEYVQSVLELDDNKLVAGGWHHTQFFDIKEFKAETDIKNTFTEHANSLIRMGDKIICSGWGIFFIDIKTQQLLTTIQIEYECEEGIYCLAPLTDNLIICGGNLRTIDIYDVNNHEKVASRPVEDEFIFDVKIERDLALFCGSKNIFGYILSEFKTGKNEAEEEEED